MTLLKIGCLLGLLALTCGQILFWRRRDNVLGYMQGGLFLATILIPLIGTDLLDRYSGEVVSLYAKLLMLGGACYMVGLCVGAPVGNRPIRPNLQMTFNTQIEDKLSRLVVFRARTLSVVGTLVLLAGYRIMGYAPLLAADRHAAKFGIGEYAAGLERGAAVYRLGLAISSVALPIIVTILFRNKRLLDLSLSCLLFASLVLSLSRALAFSGILMVLVALAIQRKVRAGLILVMVFMTFILAALTNDLLFRGEVVRGTTIPSRLAASAPDLFEHLAFLRGFNRDGEQTQGWALIAGGLSTRPGHYDPSAFALRTTYGDQGESLPSGGLRLPAPLWGYVSFGLWGAASWSFLAGFFAGWGTVRIKKLLEGVKGAPGSSLNLVLAAVYFTGTYGVLATFYFATSAKVVMFLLALYIGRVLAAPSPRIPAGDQSPDLGPPAGLRVNSL